MNDVLVSVSARTDVGMHRSGNEDSFLIADLTTDAGVGDCLNGHPIGERGSLMIVSDGMGGAAAGEIASEMAVTTIRESLTEYSIGADISEHLRKATEEANERIWNLSQENAELAGMGATVTAALVHGTVAYISQVGDSRAYLIRGSQIRQLTKDQSLAQMLVDSGAIQPEQAASVPQNVIMQALGTQPNVRVAMTTLQLYRDDCLLLCSDGLSNKISSQEMQQIIEESEDLPSACQLLIEIANQRGGEDNITVIIARFDGEPLRQMSDSVTDNFSTLKQIDPPTLKQIDLPENLEETGDRFTPTAAHLAQQERAASFAAAPQSADQQAADATTHEQTAGADEYTNEAADWPYKSQRLARKRSYSQILIITVISLMLIGAAVYFFYLYLWRSPQPDPNQAPPAPTEPEKSEH